MENKNTLIAIMLMLAVWFGYSLFFQTNYPNNQTTEQQSVSVEQISSKPLISTEDESVVEAVNFIPLLSSDQPVSGREITVDNDLYRAVFSSVGARLISFKLKKYREESDLDSPLISLVDPSSFREATLNTVGMDGIKFPVDAVYQIDSNEDEIQLTGSKKLSLNFSFIRNDGLKIVKTYIFHGDKYAFDLFLKVSNQSNQFVRGNISLSLLHPWDDSEAGDQFSFIGPVTLIADGLETDDPEDLVKEPRQYGKDVIWSAFENKYFISVIIPLNGSSEKVRIDKSNFYVRNTFESPFISIDSGQSVDFSYSMYFGPRDLNVLKGVNHDLDKAIDFGIFTIIAKPLLHVLNYFYSFIGNYGLAIIILTIIIKLLFWPLTHKSYASMKDMQKLQPQMKKLREKNKNDREKMNRELMELYKTHRVNPMGGCLPMIVQIPVFFALYKVLMDAIELRQAPFAFWLTDLSLKDPYYITPLVMGVTMFIQQKLTPSTMDPMQAKMFMFMPVIFTFLFLNFPSGLVLYWLVNNLLTILQQYYIHKKA
jgi:YidC/Oxa1 family membrane protein insertase